MRRFVSALVLVMATIVVVACHDSLVDVPRPTPAISLVLVVGETLQVAAVSIATPADSLLPDHGVPVAAGNVSLRVVDDLGGAWPVTPTATTGKFNVALSPAFGRRYTLQGTVLGRAVSFTTDVPLHFTVVSLPNDTIRSADAVPCRFSIGAESCFDVVIDSDQPMSVFCFVPPEEIPLLCDAADQFQLRVPSSAGAHTALIFGYGGDALRTRLDQTATKFGSAVLVRRTALFP